ncbi:MFS transporter [Hoeflea sp. BAL378]|uniref:MFS transporter n=1 Tax=Hoeflea sp. BAL378 TaxID=1547437 RepID=UPI0005131DE5|nr:MFS transporter [Hoeflea sp. BAL378]KGF68271.1 MFS transporter [Hoeflea sp. BAL378]
MKATITRADGHHQQHERRWIAMAVLLIAGFMNLIDVTIVNVALPSLQSGLGATSSQIEWVVAAYILAFAIGLLPLGRLGDMMGRRRIFLLGVGAFTLASTLCGLAPDINTLIAARLLQGIGGAMMTPQTLAIAQVIFPPKERAAAFALFGVTAGLAAVTGPLIGGLLINADLMGLTWRPIFLVNIPVGLFAILAGLKFIPVMDGNRDVGIDLGGIVLAALALLLVVFPLIEGRELGWPAWSFAMMVASVPAALLFARWQFRQASSGAPQLLPVSLMTNVGFMGGTLVTSLFFSAVPGFFLVLAVFLQTGYGLTPLQSGLTTVPFSLGVFISSMVSGKLGQRWQRQRIFIGSVMLSGAMLWLQMLVAGLGDALDTMLFLPPLLIAGLGLGAAVSPLFQLALAKVPDRDAGSASGGVQSFQQVGGALGVAITGHLFFTSLMGASGAALGKTGYIAALDTALYYGIFAYGLTALAVFFLQPPGVAEKAR